MLCGESILRIWDEVISYQFLLPGGRKEAGPASHTGTMLVSCHAVPSVPPQNKTDSVDKWPR